METEKKKRGRPPKRKAMEFEGMTYEGAINNALDKEVQADLDKSLADKDESQLSDDERKYLKRKKEKKSYTLNVRFTESEMQDILAKCEQYGYKNKTEYIRDCVRARVDLTPDRNVYAEVNKTMKRIGSNVNQILLLMRRTGRIYDQDIQQIKEGVNEIWHTLLSIRSGQQSAQRSLTSQTEIRPSTVYMSTLMLAEPTAQEQVRTSEQFDPGNLYSIPYCWGTVGILYNKKMVTEPIDSWSVLWDTNYRDSILMQDSVRDAFAVALKDLGYSLNSTNIKELTEAKDLLVTQKPLVQAYVVDQVRDKMIGNEAAIGVIYSGEAIYTKRENPDLEYVVPKEGSNVWIDSWCIPKDAQHVENAEKFLNFLCRPDIALKNFKYITYSTPNDAARELIEDDDIRNSEIAFPDEETLARCETFTYLGDDADEVYNQLWREVKSN